MEPTRVIRDCEWYWADKRIMTQWAPVLGVVALGVYHCLCSYANDNSGSCFPSHAAIAKTLGIHRSTVIEAVKKLIECGLVACEGRDNNSNVYKIMPVPSIQMTGSPERLVVQGDMGSRLGRQGVVVQDDTNNHNINNHNITNIGDSLKTQKTTPNSSARPPFDVEEEFDKIYSQYPRKEGRKEAIRHFKATIKTKTDIDAIWKALEAYKAYIKANKTEPQYIKMASTWFNNWEDWKDREPVKTEDTRWKAL